MADANYMRSTRISLETNFGILKLFCTPMPRGLGFSYMNDTKQADVGWVFLAKKMWKTVIMFFDITHNQNILVTVRHPCGMLLKMNTTYAVSNFTNRKL